MKYSPVRPLSKTKSKTSDHFPVIVEFTSNFCLKSVPETSKSHVIWNTNKVGGWKTFKDMAEETLVIPASDNKIDHEKN